MNNDEYVIINKTAIQKRIEDLEKTTLVREKDIVEYEVLKYWLNQSTPLIPEIEKAFDAGNAYCIGSDELFEQTHSNKENYITNLKLDI